MRTPAIEFNSPEPSPRLADLLAPPPLLSKTSLVYIIILLKLTLSKFLFFILWFIVYLKQIYSGSPPRMISGEG